MNVHLNHGHTTTSSRSVSELSICIVNAYFPPFAPGGAEFSAQELCRRLAQSGHRVAVVAPDFIGNPRREIRSGYEIHWIPSPMRLVPGQAVDTSGYIGSRAFVKSMTRAIVTQASRTGAQVIHAQNTHVFEPCVRAGHRLGIRVVGTIRDPTILCPPGVCMMDNASPLPVPCENLADMIRCGREFLQRTYGRAPLLRLLRSTVSWWLRRRHARSWLRRMDMGIAISEALRDLLIVAEIWHPERIAAIYNLPLGIPNYSAEDIAATVRSFGLESTRYFVVAGKKSLGKGTPIAIKAAELLSQRVPDARVVFAGAGQPPSPRPGVVDSPSISQQQLHCLMQGASGILIPSIVFEGLNRSMLDALVLGLPLVVTNAGGPKEGVLEGRNGFVVPKNAPLALAEAMRRVLEFGSAEQEEVQKASRELLQTRFSLARILEQMELVYSG